MRMKYHKLKDTNEHLLRQLENSQQELDNLNMKKAELEEELAMSPVKQEAGMTNCTFLDHLFDLIPAVIYQIIFLTSG